MVEGMDMSWLDMTMKSISKLVNGEGDIKSIVTIIIVLVLFNLATAVPSIVVKRIEIRQRKQYEKIADKEMWGWLQLGKKEKTYIDMLLWQYGHWTFCFIICLLLYVYLIVNLEINIWAAHVIARLAYILYSFLYGRYLWKNEKIRKCMNEEKKHNGRASLFIYLIFFITFNLITMNSLSSVAEILFGIAIAIWICYIYDGWKIKYVYENKYATIYTKESRKIRNVQAWEIKSLKGWIELPISKNGEMQKQRIRKEDIKDITYYGGPVTVTTCNKFWITLDRTVE